MSDRPPGLRPFAPPPPLCPTPGVVKQDKSSGGSVDTTKTRSGPQRVRMSGGERPIGAAKGTQTNAMASCHPPPTPFVQDTPPQCVSGSAALVPVVPLSDAGGGRPSSIHGHDTPQSHSATVHTRPVSETGRGRRAANRPGSPRHADACKVHGLCGPTPPSLPAPPKCPLPETLRRRAKGTGPTGRGRGTRTRTAAPHTDRPPPSPLLLLQVPWQTRGASAPSTTT